jgi:hypothetical protein
LCFLSVHVAVSVVSCPVDFFFSSLSLFLPVSVLGWVVLAACLPACGFGLGCCCLLPLRVLFVAALLCCFLAVTPLVVIVRLSDDSLLCATTICAATTTKTTTSSSHLIDLGSWVVVIFWPY